jgi:hypothetical protein
MVLIQIINSERETTEGERKYKPISDYVAFEIPVRQSFELGSSAHKKYLKP